MHSLVSESWLNSAVPHCTPSTSLHLPTSPHTHNESMNVCLSNEGRERRERKTWLGSCVGGEERERCVNVPHGRGVQSQHRGGAPAAAADSSRPRFWLTGDGDSVVSLRATAHLHQCHQTSAYNSNTFLSGQAASRSRSCEGFNAGAGGPDSAGCRGLRRVIDGRQLDCTLAPSGTLNVTVSSTSAMLSSSHPFSSASC